MVINFSLQTKGFFGDGVVFFWMAVSRFITGFTGQKSLLVIKKKEKLKLQNSQLRRFHR